MDPKDIPGATPATPATAQSLASAQPADPPAGPPPMLDASAEDAPVRRSAQLTMLVSIVASFVLFWWVGVALSIPALPGFGASLLHQAPAAAAMAVVTAAVLLTFTTVCAEVLVGRFWLYAGPLAAAAGLAAWSFRGGSTFFVLIAPDPQSTGTGVFRQLALESVLLGAVFAGLWAILYRKFRPPVGDEPRFTLVPSGLAAQAVLTQALLTAVGVIVLVPGAEKKQVFFGVMTASFIATGVTRHFFEGRASAHWCWAAPFLVAVFGYLAAAAGDAGRTAVQTGILTTAVSALARPLPVDYASAGVIGALLGMAMSAEDWQRARAVALRVT